MTAMVLLTTQILARDEAETLRSAIASARKLHAEVVVGVDTASADHTRELAVELADSVVDIDFMSDCGGSFAEAHNRLATLGSGRWRMKLDGHEELADDAVEPLLAALSKDDDGGGWRWRGIALRLHTTEDEGGIQAMVLRLWRPGPGVRWVRPVHETLEGLGTEVFGLPQCVLFHSRSEGRIRARRSQRFQHDAALLRAMLEQKADDGVTHWHLADLCLEHGDLADAHAAGLRAWELGLVSGAKAAHLVRIALGMARIELGLGNTDAAMRWTHEAEARHWNVPELWCLRGEIAERESNPARAAFFYRAAMLIEVVPVEIPIQVRFHTWFPHWRLGRLALAKGEVSTAATQYGQALAFPLPQDVQNELAPWAAMLARR